MADPIPDSNPQDPSPASGATPPVVPQYEIVVSQGGQVLYRLRTEHPVVMFDDEAITDPAKLTGGAGEPG